MKGIVFTEFLEMVEAQFGESVVDQVIEASNLPNGGAYTAVGTYSSSEMLRLISSLSIATQTPAANLSRAFGQYLFKRFSQVYPSMFAGTTHALAFLKTIDQHIHVQVRKLYPDAELPSFSFHEPQPGQLVMIYESHRPLADLAEGLIQGCIAYFGETITLERNNLQSGELNRERFVLTHVAVR